MRQDKILLAKTQLQAGYLKTLEDLIILIGKTNFAAACKTMPQRLQRMLDNPGLFCWDDVDNLANTLGVDDKIIIDLVHGYFTTWKKKQG